MPAGKGSKRRPGNDYAANWDRIFGVLDAEEVQQAEMDELRESLRQAGNTPEEIEAIIEERL